MRARLCSRREGEGDVQGPVRWNHDLPLQHGVEPVGRHTAFALSESLGEHKDAQNKGAKT